MAFCISNDHRFFNGVHAAHRRAVGIVAPVQVAGSDALQPGDFFGLALVFGHAQHVTGRGPGGGQHALEFQGGQHVGIAAVLILIVPRRVEGPVSGRQNDGADIQRVVLRLLVEIDRSHRTDFFTGTAPVFLDVDAAVSVDAVFERHRLGVLHEGGPALAEPGVVSVDDLLGALFGTGAAADAQGLIDVAGLAGDIDGKTADFPLDLLDFAEGSQLDVQMPADLDQFRGNDSHRAVIGGKGLVQLGHDPADGRTLLHQVHIVSGVREIEGRLHAGNPSADHHNRTDYIF